MSGIDLTEVDAFTDPVNVIADGEMLSNAVLRRGHQATANRTRWLYNRAVGVLSDFDELRAVTGMVNGEKAYVQGEGIYEYRASDVTAERVPWIIDPTASGAGRWFHVDYSKRPLVYQYKNTTTGSFLVGHTSATYADVPLLEVDVPDCVVGDVLVIDASFLLSSNTSVAGRDTDARLAVDDSAGTNALDESRIRMTAQGTDGATSITATPHAAHVVTHAGTNTCKVQLASPDGDGVRVDGPVLLRVLRLRGA